MATACSRPLHCSIATKCPLLLDSLAFSPHLLYIYRAVNINFKFSRFSAPPCIIRIIKLRRVARMGEKRNTYRLLVRKPEGNRLLRRPRRRWVDNIRMDLGEMGWGDVDWIGLTQDRNRWRTLVNFVLNHQVSQNAGKPSSGLITGGISSSAQLHIVC
jgi:hypothetical protein